MPRDTLGVVVTSTDDSDLAVTVKLALPYSSPANACLTSALAFGNKDSDH
jgi:hypothetical protein